MKILKSIGLILIGMAVMGVLAGTAWTVSAYRRPLGSALATSVGTATSIVIPVSSTSAVVPTAAPAAQPAATAVATMVPTLAPVSVCGETGAWNILVLGSDAADLIYPKGSDLTRVLRVDFSNRKVIAYAFSRDLWVSTLDLGLTNPNITETRLGQVFYEARIRSPQADIRARMTDATSATAKMIYQNFNLGADHYITLDMSQFPAMVDTIGGIPVNIPARVVDTVDGSVFEAGQQTLYGYRLLSYARTLPSSDFERIGRNNLLVEALRQKLIEPSLWTNIPQLYLRFKDSIATDLSPEQINHLSCLMKEVPTNAIVQEQVKQEWTSAGPQPGSLRWDKARVINHLQTLGLIP